MQVTHSRNAVRFIFDRAPGLGDRERRTHLRALAEAFTACQAEQARVIDAIYGELSGRDRGLREQVLAMLDQCKQRTLDEVWVAAPIHGPIPAPSRPPSRPPSRHCVLSPSGPISRHSRHTCNDLNPCRV